MLGFVPGFTYMGTVDPRIAVPRMTSPRGFASRLAQSASPDRRRASIRRRRQADGRSLVRRPSEPFDIDRPEPFLFKPGDAVQFYAIDAAEYGRLAEVSMNAVHPRDRPRHADDDSGSRTVGMAEPRRAGRRTDGSACASAGQYAGRESCGRGDARSDAGGTGTGVRGRTSRCGDGCGVRDHAGWTAGADERCLQRGGRRGAAVWRAASWRARLCRESAAGSRFRPCSGAGRRTCPAAWAVSTAERFAPAIACR